ncbi:MAG: xanthine dehydrogenase family protein subunit M [Burkholderiaceae bacterium]
MQTLRPADLDDALSVLADGVAVGRVPTPLAGATDLYPALAGLPRPHEAFLDLSGLAELRGVEQVEIGSRPFWRLGALTRWSELARGPLRRPDWAALCEAAGEIGARQIQNRGTIGGNLCHASPAADGIVALLALDAQVQLRRSGGVRRLPLDGFVLGPRQTALGAGELLESVLIPVAAGRRTSRFLKLGQRRYLVISAVMVAGGITWNELGRVASARIAVGACGPRAVCLPWLAQAACGRDQAGLAALADQAWPGDALAPLTPIDDIRGSAGWRLESAQVLVRRLLHELARDALPFEENA